MHWHHISPGHAVLEIDYGSPTTDEVGKAEVARLGFDLAVWWGGGALRAAWVWSATGELAGWAVVGEA